MTRRAYLTPLIAALTALTGACDKSAGPSDTPAAPTTATAPATTGGQLEATLEQEPNNTAAEATPLPLDTAGTGHISVPAVSTDAKGKEKKTVDRDYWKFEITGEPKDVRLELSGLATVDLALKLYTERDTREPIANAYSNMDTDKENNGRLGEVIPSIVLQPGVYIARIAQFKPKRSTEDKGDDDASYTLVVTAAAVRPDFEAEPNDRRVDATTLTTEMPRKGYLGWKKDEDWYKLELPQLPGAKVLKLELDTPLGMRPTISVRNEIEAVLKSVSAQKEGDPIVLPNYYIDDPTNQLFVVVEAHWDHNTKEPYTLRASLTDATGEMEREANDRPVEATILTDTSRVRGFIDQGRRLMEAPWRRADEDWYRFSFDEVKQLSLAVSGLPEVDLILAVYDTEGKVKVLDVNDNGKKEGEVIPRLVLKEGLIKVSSRPGHFNAEHPYELVLKTFPDDRHTEIEPNNDPGTARPITVGDDMGWRGWLHPSKDVDVYLLDLAGRPTKSYTFEVSGIPLAKVAVAIADADGKEVAAKAANQTKIPVKLTHELPGAVYTVKVYKRGKPNPKDPYTLKVSEQ